MANVITLANIAALETYAGTDPVIWVEGFASVADGGEGMFAYAGSSGYTANGGTIILTTASGSNRYYVREYNNDPLNISWFGATGATTSDCSAALLSALAALPAQGGTIYFPSGVFYFNSSVTYTIPGSATVFSVSFVGNGQDATILYWPKMTPAGAAGIVVNASQSGHSVHFRDMAVTTGYTCANSGITVIQSSSGENNFQNDFVRLTFTGYPFSSSTFPTAYWGVAINIEGLSNVTYDTLLVFMGSESGTAINIAGGSTNFSVVHNLSKCTTWYGSGGLVIGPYVQGVTVSQGNFTDCLYGINVPSGQSGCGQLAVVASQLACIDNAIYIQSDFNGLYVSANLFYYPYSGAIAGINITGIVTQAAIIGNSFFGLPGSGGSLTSSGIITGPSTSGVISGNVFGRLSVGVNLTGTNGWNLLGNAYTAGTVTTQYVPGSGVNSIATATA